MLKCPTLYKHPLHIVNVRFVVRPCSPQFPHFVQHCDVRFLIDADDHNAMQVQDTVHSEQRDQLMWLNSSSHTQKPHMLECN